MKRLLAFLLCFVMLFSLAACDKQDHTDPSGDPPAPSTPPEPSITTYTVSVRSVGGMALPYVDVYIFVEDQWDNVLMQGTTDTYGQAVFDLPENGNYVAVLSGAPDGYAIEPYYPFSGKTCDIALTSSLIQGGSVNGHHFQVGDVMYDFSVTTPEGDTLTLSDILAEKKMVMLTFWSARSQNMEELSVLQAVYKEHGDLFEILALDSYPTDTLENIENVRDILGLTFPLAQCDIRFEPGCFGSDAYPTFVFIDRYGVICMIREGTIGRQSDLNAFVKHFISDYYWQQLIYDRYPPSSPQAPGYNPWQDSDAIAEIMGTAGNPNIYYHHEEDPELERVCWPFIQGEYNGETVLQNSNLGVNNSCAVLYMDVTLQAGQAFAFDYICSTESNADLVYITVDGKEICTFSGDTSAQGWQSCYPWVADADGTYEVVIRYVKDNRIYAGDDTFYIKNARIIDAADIDTPTYIPREVALQQADGSFLYENIVFNEADGYYHVGTEDGPLLLANLMGPTQFLPDDYVWNLFYKGLVHVDSKTMTDMEWFSNCALNSTPSNYCTVTKELAAILQIVDNQLGASPDDTLEWLKFCRYYEAYGTNGAQMPDPVEGLAPFSALNAQEGTGWYNAETGEISDYNCFYFDGRPIMPRGKFAKFVPEKSGVYMITSADVTTSLYDGWLFNAQRELLTDSDGKYVHFRNQAPVVMLYYMEAGKDYYVNMGPDDIYEVCYISFSIQYMGESMDVLALCSPGNFTFDEEILEMTGAYVTVPGGIKAVLNPQDNRYYEDLGKDAGGNQLYGSPIYVTFTDCVDILDLPIYSTDGDSFLTTDGFIFDGMDYSGFIMAHMDRMITEGELYGCYHVTKELAEVLQMLMNKYTFEGVANSWLKLCYYYEHLGPKT